MLRNTTTAASHYAWVHDLWSLAERDSGKARQLAKLFYLGRKKWSGITEIVKHLPFNNPAFAAVMLFGTLTLTRHYNLTHLFFMIPVFS